MPLSDVRALLEAELDAKDTERRVLGVDDEDHVRKMLLKILGNYDVVAVGSGADAIETAMESKPDLVITDIRMPEMDGYALLGKLRVVSPGSARDRLHRICQGRGHPRIRLRWFSSETDGHRAIQECRRLSAGWLQHRLTAPPLLASSFPGFSCLALDGSHDSIRAHR